MRLIRPHPETLEATWHPAERHVLIGRVGGDDPIAAMDALLTGWAKLVKERLGGTTRLRR